MLPIPPLNFTGGAATGGMAGNHSINQVGTGTTSSLAQLVQLSNGAEANGGFTETAGFTGGLTRDTGASKYLPIIAIGIGVILLIKYGGLT